MKLGIFVLGLVLSLSAGAASQIELVNVSHPGVTEDFLSYNFGTVFVNSRTSVRYNVRNTGDTPLNFQDAVIYGADFSANHSCRGTLLPGQVCQFEVYYWPMFEGMASGRFQLTFVEDQIVLDLWGNARRM